MSEDSFFVSVTNCARCGETHDIRFTRFQRPSGDWTHWGMCQQTGEPVLLKIVEERAP
jgi:hypothetical protein